MNGCELIKQLLEVLRKEREQQTMRQQDLAYQSELSKTNLSELENGHKADMKLSTFLKLCRALRIAPWKIMLKAWGNMFEEEGRE